MLYVLATSSPRLLDAEPPMVLRMAGGSVWQALSAAVCVWTIRALCPHINMDTHASRLDTSSRSENPPLA